MGLHIRFSLRGRLGRAWRAVMGRREKVYWQSNAAILRELRDRGAPLPRDAVFLPRINRLHAAIFLATAGPPEGFRDGHPAAEALDQCCVIIVHDAGTVQNIFGLVKADLSEMTSGDLPNGFRHALDVVRAREKPAKTSDEPAGEKAAVGQRLRRAREALGFTLRKLADETGVSEDNLGNWERGVALAPHWFIRRLHRAWGVDYSWVYDGDARRLPHDLALKLLAEDKG